MIFYAEKENRNKELLDLVYDIEKFLVDLEYQGTRECSPDKQAYLGKLELAKKAYAEKERKAVYLKIRPVLADMGVREDIKGFRLICTLVYHAVERRKQSIEFYLCEGYEKAAREFGISKACCERLCRYACGGISFDKEFSLKYPSLDYITHRTYEKVTVKELVEALSEYVCLKFKAKNKII